MPAIGNYVDPSEYYELAAEHIASRYGNPLIVNGNADLIRALVAGIPNDVLDSIEAEPDAWARRVAEYCYAMAMQACPEY